MSRTPTLTVSPRRAAARRLAALGAWLLASGCALALPRLPAAEAGTRRDRVEPVSTRCGGSECTTRVAVGARRVEVASRTRTIAAEEVTGRSAGSLGRRAVSAVGGAMLRRIGGTTSTLRVGLGTRWIADPAGTLALVCDVAWIDEETRGREQDVEVTRLGSGGACAAVARADGVTPRWRVRHGISPVRDSLAIVVDAIDRGTFDAAWGDASLAIERVPAPNDPAPRRYDVVFTAPRAAGSGAHRPAGAALDR